VIRAAWEITGWGYAALVAAWIAIGAGECFHTAVLMPLVADLAPPGIRGRYMATMGLSWWTELALGPYSEPSCWTSPRTHIRLLRRRSERSRRVDARAGTAPAGRVAADAAPTATGL
jgi:hypothetical protein